jgi:hypothetical protein
VQEEPYAVCSASWDVPVPSSGRESRRTQDARQAGVVKEVRAADASKQASRLADEQASKAGMKLMDRGCWKSRQGRCRTAVHVGELRDLIGGPSASHTKSWSPLSPR